MKKISLIFLITISLLLTSCFKKEEEIIDNKNNIKKEDLVFDNNVDFIVEDWSGNIIVQNTWSLTKVIDNKKVVKNLNKKIFISSSGTTMDNKNWSWEIQSNSWITVSINDEKNIEIFDASISDEKEYLSEEEKEFMKNEIEEVDTSSYVKFNNSIYSKDKNNVYFYLYWLNKLSWVDPKTFKVLQPDWYYWTDWTWIYMLEKKMDEMDFSSLKFVKLNDKLTIWWDKNNLYIWSRLIIKWWDINFVESISENCIKDNLNIYCTYNDYWITKEWDSYEIIERVDLDTYSPYDYFYAKDKDNIYFEWIIVDDVDIDSFKVFNDSSFAIDKNNAYYDWIKITWINDLKSFTVVNWTPQDKICSYKIDPLDNSANCEVEEIEIEYNNLENSTDTIQ